jgi:hypothetical protein
MGPKIGDSPDPVRRMKISSTRRPTITERMHKADLAIFVDHKDGVRVVKNRHGPHGKVSTKELINILTRILVEHVFDGRMKVFQEGMKWRLKGAINKIVKDGA